MRHHALKLQEFLTCGVLCQENLKNQFMLKIITITLKEKIAKIYLFYRACSPTVEYLACTEEFRVQFPAGPCIRCWMKWNLFGTDGTKNSRTTKKFFQSAGPYFSVKRDYTIK